MTMKKTGFLCFILALTGCVNASHKAPESLVTPSPSAAEMNTSEQQKTAPQPDAIESSTSSLMANSTCLKELAALQTYSPRNWNKYSEEMSALTGKTSQFLSVKQDLNPRINQLVMNVYQARMQTLCYKIESALGQAMIDQASRLGE